MLESFLNLFAASSDSQGAQQIFVWILIIFGLIGGLVAPFLTRAKSKSIAIYIAGWVWWFIFTFVVSQLLIVLLSLPFILTLGRGMMSNVGFSVTTQVLTYVFMTAIMILLPYKQWKNSKKPPKKKNATRQFILKLAGLDSKPCLNDIKQTLITFPIYFVTNLAVSIVLTLALGDKIMGQEQNIGFATTGQAPFMLILIGFCLVIAAPVFEEILMRGILLGKLSEKLKFWPAAFITAVVFALIHGQINVGVMTFILAMYAASLRKKTGAIWSSIMLHTLQNLIAFCILVS